MLVTEMESLKGTSLLMESELVRKRVDWLELSLRVIALVEFAL
jgi:hypothetical protein